jgi:hypothetical protein
LKTVFGAQIKSLEELDFNDLIEFELNEKSVKEIKSIIEKNKLNELQVQFDSVEEKEKLLGEDKTKSSRTALSLKEAIDLLKKLVGFPFKEKITFFASPIKLEIMHKKIFLKGPYSKIQKK